MRKIIILSIAFLVITSSLLSQTSTVSGKVSDTLEKRFLPYAVISLLHKKDSSLALFTRTDKDGAFQLRDLVPGNYRMLITYPKFADYGDELDLTKGGETNLGTIALTQKSLLLKEVIVRSGQAIRIKGDTTEFTADSFVVKEGATVEDLLKILPGFQVNSKGEITTQGKRVEKVLVDGEEFFGDDPTMATQNLSSKSVDKVQVFESKTDQQQLTGISTGNEGKTLNIKLKEDKKRGAFGKINAGTDFTKYYDAKVLYNKFVGKKKVSLYGTRTNITTGSLNWEDQQKLGIEDDYEYDEISGYYFSESSGDNDFNSWSYRGLPNAYTAGALFINKWNEDKQNINTSYRYNRLGTVNQSSRLVQSILNNTINYRNSYTNNNGFVQQHAVNGKYEWKLDSLTSFKFSTANVYKTSQTIAATQSEYLNSNKAFINTNDQQRNSATKRVQSTNVLTYKQLFNKKNRQLLTTLRYGVTDDDNTGNINTRTEFYKNGVADSLDLLDQMKMFRGTAKTFGSKITFSEPFSAKWNLVVDYAFNTSNSTSNRNTFNKDNNGKYEVLDSVFSNNFDLKAVSNSSTALLRFIDKKLKFTFGSGISNVTLKLHDVDSGNRTNYSFLRFTPQAQIGYTIKPQTNVSLNYRGTTRQPSIEQLQPIRDNSDNLNIFVGNPDLKVGFNHGFNAFFNQYKVLSGRSVWLSANYNIYNNAIANYTIIDTVRGKQIYTPVNVNGNRNWGFYSNWHKGQGEKKMRYGVQLNGNGGRNISFINQNSIVRENATNYFTVNFSLSTGYQESEKVSFDIRPTIGYNKTKSSLGINVNNNYFTYGGNLNGFVMLPGKLELSADANVELREKTPAFQNNMNLVILNANLARKIFKKKTGKIILVANDILNQNQGFNRIINSNFIQEERYLRVSRYFLLKFEWTFNKLPGSK